MSNWPRSTPDYDKLAAEKRLTAQRTTGTPAATGGMTAESRMMTLRALAIAAAPTAKRKTSVSLDEDGVMPGCYRYTIKLYGPDVIKAVVQSGATPEEAAHGLKRAWATARREKEVEALVRECSRLAGGEFTDDAQAKLRADLAFGECPPDAYPGRAAKWRKAAQKHAENYNQAA